LLIVHLLLSRYLGEAFSSTAYSVNVYIVPGELALRLTRFTRADILAGKGPRIHCSFRRPHQRKSSWTDATAGRKKKQPAQSNGAAAVKAKPEVDDARIPGAAGPSRLPHLLGNALPKKKRPHEVVEASEEEEIDELEDNIDEAPPSDAECSEDENGEGGGDWEYSLRPSAGTSKKRRVSFPPKGPLKHANKRDLDDDVISLSSD
jgi:ATP-dependent DNA helicase Q1